MGLLYGLLVKVIISAEVRLGRLADSQVNVMSSGFIVKGSFKVIV
jgi:hypothetical protein